VVVALKWYLKFELHPELTERDSGWCLIEHLAGVGDGDEEKEEIGTPLESLCGVSGMGIGTQSPHELLYFLAPAP